METEGLFTTIWGSDMWRSLHNITFNYPYEPTDDDKKKYYNYFISLGDVLPCCTCRKSYNKHIRNGDTMLTQDVLHNRDTLTYWLYNLHFKVCEKLGFYYDLTYDMVKKKHESYIAKCELTNEQKMNAYKNYYDVHAPVVKLNMLHCFVNYAKERGLPEYENNIVKYSSMDRMSDEWYNRNEECQKLIKYIRLNGINLVEKEGKYEGLMSIEQLKLMELTSTMLSRKNMKKILKKMGCHVKKIYKFTDS